MKKRYLGYFAILVINIFIIFLFITSYALLLKFNIIHTPKIISQNKFYRQLYSKIFFTKKENQLIKILNENYYDFYPAIELGGDHEHLSKKLFDFPIIDGEKTFIHKPNIKKLMIIIPNENNKSKTINFSLPYDKKLENLIKDIVVTETDKNQLSFFRITTSTFDKNGLRKNSVENKKSLANIIFIGDSYTEGLYVNDSDTFVNKLAEIMLESNYVYPINAGCNGYGTKNELLLLKKLTSLFKFNTVVLIHAFNDVINNQELLFTGKSKELSSAWDKNFKLLEQVKSICNENKIKLIIIPFPNLFQFINNELDTKKYYQDKLAKFCNEKDITFIDIFDDLKERISLNPEKIKKNNSNQLFFEYQSFYEKNIETAIYIPFDDHLSEYGHKIFAELLWKKLKELK